MRAAPVALALIAISCATPLHADFVNFESQHVRPLTLTPSGARLLAVNTPDNHLAVFDVTPGGLVYAFEVPVGLEPVSVVSRTETEAWVANHVSDTVSIVDLATRTVSATLQVGDEPTDIVFAGSPARAFVCVSQEDRIRIFDPDDLQAPPVAVDLMASDPQALAVSPDGATVYAAIFESNNHTTIASTEDVLAHGGLPEPNPEGRPDVGLILRFEDGAWRDELGRDYSDTHPYVVVDHDVAVLDANAATPVPTYFESLGTLNFNLGVHPISGQVYVSNIDAQNHIRFEPELRGRFIRTRVSIVDPLAPASPNIVDLNPHIDYDVSPGAPFEIELSLSHPGGMAFSADGASIYLTALGSETVAVLDENGAVVDRLDVGSGPSGVVVDELHDVLYVMHRFTNSVGVVDRPTGLMVSEVAMHDPSPDVVRLGREFLYDGRTSGHGDASCASCHPGAHFDNIAWDLGDPEGVFVPAPFPQTDPFVEGWPAMKGPMTTQTLRGLDGTQPFHWRGDREDFVDFNGAFVGLMGLDAELPTEDMQAFQDFILTVALPPNPGQLLDRSYPDPPVGPNPTMGETAFLNLGTTIVNGSLRTCRQCHNEENGGTNGRLVNAGHLQETQDFKIPQLRNMYEKTGYSREPGVHKRGFGFSHDGSIGTVVDFLSSSRFQFNTEQRRENVAAFVTAFDTGTAPAVGAQWTVDEFNRDDPSTEQWLAVMKIQQPSGNADLVVKGRVQGDPRGWVFAGGDAFVADAQALPAQSTAELLALVGPTTTLTFTGVPPGCGTRIGIDRDRDGALDYDEVNAGTDPADPLSTPVTTSVEPLAAVPGGGFGRVLLFPNPAPVGTARLSFELGARSATRVRVYDVAGRMVASVLDAPAGPGRVHVRWNGEDQSGRVAASGRYFYRLESAGEVETRPFMLVR